MHKILVRNTAVYFPSKTAIFKAEEEKKLVEEPKAVAEREVSATFRVPVEVEFYHIYINSHNLGELFGNL